VPYAEEILDGELTHLAIVKNPRYEGARITLVNSKGGSMWKWFKRGERKNAASLDPLKTKVNVDGADVALQDLYEAAKESDAPVLNDDTIMEVDGKEKTLGELKQAYRNKMKQNADKACPTCGAEKANAEPKEDAPGEKHPLPDLRRTNADAEALAKADEDKKNAADAEAKKDEEKKNGIEDLKALEEKKNADEKALEEKKNAEEAKLKADEELKQAAADKAEKDEVAKQLANSKREAGRKSFMALRNAREEHMGEPAKINPVSVDERLARGKSKYGSPA
jgi:DNA repair exonuclease SbcCD ATPase subunit